MENATADIVRPFQPNNDTVQLQELCEVCSRLCSLSPLLSGKMRRFDSFSGSGFGRQPQIDKWLRSVDECRLRFEASHPAEFGTGSDDGELKLEAEYSHHSSGAALELSSRLGCHLCSLLWNIVIFGQPPHTTKIIKEKENRRAREQLKIDAPGPPGATLTIRIGHRRSYHSRQCGVIVLYAGKVGSFEALPLLRTGLTTMRSVEGSKFGKFTFTFREAFC